MDETGKHKMSTEDEIQETDEALIEQYAEDYQQRTAETGRFSERIGIEPDGTLDWGMREERITTAHMPNVEHPGGTEGLYVAASRVQTRFPQFIFSFERDPEGKWIKYTVVNSNVTPPPSE